MARNPQNDEPVDAARATPTAPAGVPEQDVARPAPDREERARHQAAVDAAAERLAGRWGAVLDRLGSA